MGVGKYSPTVSHSYSVEQQWFEKNGGGYGNGINPESENDDDGYDSYGYSGKFGDGPDRAGNTEDQYAESYQIFHDETQYYLYDNVSHEYSLFNILENREKKKELSKDPVFQKELELQRELKAIIEEAQAHLAPIENSINKKMISKSPQKQFT